MFYARFEPSISKYILQHETDLYYFSEEEIRDDLKNGDVIINTSYPRGGMSAPLQFQIAITEKCNFNCKNCYDTDVNHGIASNDELCLEEKKELLDYLHDWGVLLIQWSGGEPLLSKDLKNLVAYARRKKFAQSLLTNGSRLANEDLAKWTAANFERVQISFNAVDRFKEWTGTGNFQTLMRGMLNTARYCAEYETAFNITTTVNEVSVSELEKIAYWINKIKPTTWRIGEEVPLGKAVKILHHLELLEKSYREFLKLKALYKNENWKHCFEIEKGDSIFPIEWQSSPAGRTMLYMSSIGEIYPFPYLKMPEFYLGKYPRDDLKDIWFNSPALKELRSVCYDNTDCAGCKNACVRWAREINFHFSRNINESPLPFTNCPRSNPERR